MDILLVIACLFICVALGVPIAYSLGLAAIAGAFWIGIPIEAVMLKISDGVSKVAMLTIPFFVLAGAIMAEGGMARRLVAFANVLVGFVRLRGGLSIVNVLAATRLQGSIEEFKAEAAGDFANDATTLETRTWLAAVFSRESASPDFINRALAAISATTPADVQRVARIYLGNPTIALVLPRGTSLQN